MRSAPLNLLLGSSIATVLVAAGCSGYEVPPECEYAVCSNGRCVLDSHGDPECVCDAFAQATFRHCELLYFDTPEQDDLPTQATLLIPPVGPLAASLAPREAPMGDVDYYKVQVKGRHAVRFRADAAADGGVRPVVKVVDGTPSEAIPGSNTSMVWFEAADAGTVLIEVAGSPPGSAGSYTFAVEDMGVDAPGSGITVAPGVTFSGEFLPPGGRLDVYPIDGGPGELVRFECEGRVRLNLAADTTVRWARTPSSLVVEFPMAPAEVKLWVESEEPFVRYGCTTTSLGLDDHPDTAANATAISSFQGTELAVRTDVHWDTDYLSLPLTPTHCYALSCGPACTVRPSRFELDTDRSPVLELKGDPGEHTLRITDLGPDDHGDTLAAATLLDVGAATRRFETDSDVDVFAFDPTPGVIYRWTCPSSCRANWISDASARLVQDYQDHATTRTFKVSAAARAIYTDPADWVGDPATEYPIGIEVLGVDDHGDDIESASPLSVDTAATAELQLSGDQDFFRIHLPVGSYRIVRDPTSYELAWAALQDASGATLPATSTSWQVNAEGDYFVRVYGGWGYYPHPAPTVSAPWELKFRITP